MILMFQLLHKNNPDSVTERKRLKISIFVPTMQRLQQLSHALSGPTLKKLPEYYSGSETVSTVVPTAHIAEQCYLPLSVVPKQCPLYLYESENTIR